MRRIIKGAEPTCLAGTRREAARIENESGNAPDAQDWDLKDCAQPVRTQLHGEQGGLCAYCSGRITSLPYEPTTRTGMKIEHFVPRSKDPRQMYAWPNLLGVCGGRYQWGGKVVRTCDEHRADEDLHICPAAGTPEEAFSPRRDGTLKASTADAEHDLLALNLQAKVLCQNRKAVIEILQRRLATDDSDKNLRGLLKVATTPPFPAYSFVAVWYLNLKLRGRHR